MNVLLTDEEARKIERALSRTIVHLIAFSDDKPYEDDPRWSPWTRWQKPLANRCRESRSILREKKEP